MSVIVYVLAVVVGVVADYHYAAGVTTWFRFGMWCCAGCIALASICSGWGTSSEEYDKSR